MPAWPGEGCTPRPAACSLAGGSLFAFFRRARPQTQGLHRLRPSAPRGHTPPAALCEVRQTEAFHGLTSSTRSSSHRRPEWVTESYSGGKKAQ